jgi:GNAT superfamily N-acetyltransferase
VVEDGDVIVGFASFSADLLGHIYVTPRAQHHGVGRLLLDKVKQLRPNGFTLWTHQPNAQARRFYERQGLEAVEFTDGSSNQEKVADVRYAWRQEGGGSHA